MNFSFYNIVSFQGFSAVLYIIYTSTCYQFSFPKRSKRFQIDILRWLFAILSKEYKEVIIIHVDEDGALACCHDFINLYKRII